MRKNNECKDLIYVVSENTQYLEIILKCSRFAGKNLICLKEDLNKVARYTGSKDRKN